jgi:transcriptional regulator with XRE-family HTH domain
VDPARRDEAAVTGGLLGRSESGPTALRIMLGGQLRRLRESSGVSREEAGSAIRATHSKISRLELGRSSFKQRDVADLLTLYGVTAEEERETLLALARQASTPGWWHQYNDVMPNWLESYVGLEETASVIRGYEMQFVHGLLQTPDYARAVVMLRHTDAPGSEIERRVSLRMRRQRLFAREDPPTLWAVLDEAALRRPLGGRQVMRGQLDHLLESSTRPNITLLIIPFAAGGHAAAGGPFTILRFAQPDIPDVVYLEQLNSAIYLDKQEDVDDYTAVLNQLSVVAGSVDATDILHTIRKET